MYLSKIFKLCASTLLILTASVSLTSIAVSAAPVKIGLNTWIGFGPLYIAEKLGTFKKYGVDVKFVKFQDGSLVPPAIESNALDGGAITYDQVIGRTAKDLTQKVLSRALKISKVKR
jgi:NitT/TauT family transport system substrate-binding protein